MILSFLLGVYLTGALFSFLFVGFFVGLGGDNQDLWKPFAYSVIWPIGIPLFLAGKI